MASYNCEEWLRDQTTGLQLFELICELAVGSRPVITHQDLETNSGVKRRSLLQVVRKLESPLLLQPRPQRCVSR
jgi:hypothetical protein